MAALPQTAPPISARTSLASSDPIDSRIAAFLNADEASRAPAAQLFKALIAAGLDRIPFPAHGATLERWRCLAEVARHDLALVKLYESHTDALAILDEIETRHAAQPGVAYAVWASESREHPLKIRGSGGHLDDGSPVTLDGRKTWCSGARLVDRALVTASDQDGGRWLVELDLASRGIVIDEAAWNAVGMRDSASYTVVCDDVAARIVGGANAYLDRPGFWHGGAGIAACWFGAAAAIATIVGDLQIGRDDVHALAHLGAIDCALASGGALLRECAADIDDEIDGERDAESGASSVAGFAHRALRVRSAIADVAEIVIHRAARAVGPGPLCNDARLARLVADLPVFVRQCRAEHDLVAQSRALLSQMRANMRDTRESGWTL